MPSVIVAIVLALSLFAARAQAIVTLFGTIEDQSGAVVPNTLVVAFNDDTGIRRSALSDHEGFYAIASLPQGHYKLLVRKEGFLTTARTGLNLGYQQNVRCNFLLQVGPVEQVVLVEGGPSSVNSPMGSPATVLRGKLIDELPLGTRSLAGLLELAPGILTTPANTGEAGQFSANGQRPNTNSFTVDGVSRNSGVSGAATPGQFPGATLPSMTAIGSMHNLASLDAIDEVQIETSGISPEYGRMPGAQVAIATRSGSNDFHGTVSDSFNNARVNANDWLANASGLTRPRTRMNDFAAALGGPIRRNRTFFFGSYEQIDLRQPIVWRTPVPTTDARAGASPIVAALVAAFPLANGPSLGGGLAELTVSATRPGQTRAASFRVDHALTSNIDVFARYSHSPSWSEFGYSQVGRSDFRDDNVTAGLVATISPSVTNDLRVSTSATKVHSSWSSTLDGGAGPLDLSSWLPWHVGFQNLSVDGVGSLVTGDGGRNSQNQLNIVESLASNRGGHRVRLGADYERLALRRQGPATSLSLNFPSLASLLAGQSGRLTYAQDSAESTHLHTLALFAMDTWTLNRRLTLTYGVRWEMAPAPPSQPNHLVYSQAVGAAAAGTPIWHGSFTNFAPRVSLAYRIKADGRSVLRGGAGVFYDTGLGAATDEINGAPFNSWRLGGPATGSQAPATALLYGFAHDLRLPRSLEWNITWQRDWSGRGVTSLSYVGTQGTQLLRREGMLAPTGQIAELELATSHGASTYDALHAEYRRRVAGGLEGLLSYSWSHSIDTGSWDSSVYLVRPGLGPARDRADSNFDARHAFTAALTYDVKLLRGPRFLTQGWNVGSIFRGRTGFPVDVLTAETLDGLNFANVVRPDLVPGQPVWITDANVPGGERLNPAAFRSPANTLAGNLGRNAIRGFGMSQLDISLSRAIAIHERASLDIRAEAANVLNQSNFADPERYLASPLFGQPASMLNLMLGGGTPGSGLTPAFQIGGPRMVQLGLRLRF